MATEEITISELELADEVLADMTLPVDTAKETRAVTLKQLRAWLGPSLPTGFIIPAVGKISDERFTLLDGKTLSKQGTYGAFCAKVEEQVQAENWFACSEDEYNSDISNYGQCGKFVVSNDYIRIPTITRFIGATITLSEIGRTYKESLPQHTHTRGTMNITGTAGIAASPATTTGCFYLGSENSYNGYDGKASTIHFDASRKWTGATSNASGETYQSNAKVQPDHTKYPYYMVISTEGQTAEVGIDINQVYEDLNIKANTSLSNVDANIDYVVEKGGDSNGWYRIYKSGWIEQGGLVTSKQAGTTVTLLKPYANANYLLLAQVNNQNVLAYNDGQIFCNNKTTTNFNVTSFGSPMASWFACGQGA